MSLGLEPVSLPVRFSIAALSLTNLYSVEYSPDFAEHLREDFPGVNIIEGDAFNLDVTLGDKRDQKFDWWSLRCRF